MSSRSEVPDDDPIRLDVEKMVGGHFTPDAIGPEAYDAVLARARAGASAYLDVFEKVFLGDSFDGEEHSNRFVQIFLQHVASVEPERARDVARRLDRLYSQILVVPDAALDRARVFELLEPDAVGFIKRLGARRAQLRQLLR